MIPAWLFVVTLGGCGSAAISTTACAFAAPSSPQRTSIPSSPSRVVAYTVMLGQWRMTGSYVTKKADAVCTQGLPTRGFILGVDPTTCEPRVSDGVATTVMPASDDRRIVVLRIACPGGCADAVTAQGSGGGRVVIAVNDQILWTALCNSEGACDSLALGESPIVAFVADAGKAHKIELIASSGARWPIAEIQAEWRKIPLLIQGIAYSPFRDCQNPNRGIYPSEEEIRQDLALVCHMGNGIRTYSSTGVQGKIPELARQLGMRVSAGAWLGKDRKSNEKEIAALISLAQTVDLESVIVGNEVLLRNDLNEDELIDYIQRVRSAVVVPVTTAEIGSHLLDHPRVMAVLDYYLVHYYAYWDAQPIAGAARYVLDKYHEFQKRAGGKRVVIGETGWPSAGPPNRDAIPSPENQRRFLREFLTVAQREGVEFYYFAAFDELWKSEGGVGPYWGVMRADRHNKYDLQSMLIPLNDTPLPAGARLA